jgi:hypothetical protein
MLAPFSSRYLDPRPRPPLAAAADGGRDSEENKTRSATRPKALRGVPTGNRDGRFPGGHGLAVTKAPDERPAAAALF